MRGAQTHSAFDAAHTSSGARTSMKQLSVAQLSRWPADSARDPPRLLDVRETWGFENDRVPFRTPQLRRSVYERGARCCRRGRKGMSQQRAMRSCFVALAAAPAV